MITRLEIDGFKSLRDFAVDLDPLTVFVGPNGAGKSNILEALALLSRLATQPLADAFRHGDRRGRGRPGDQFTWQGGEELRTMRLALEFLDYRHHLGPRVESQTRYRHELTIERQQLASGAERLLARDECFRALRREEDAWIAARPEFRKYAEYALGGAELPLPARHQLSTEQQLLALAPVFPDRDPSSPAERARFEVLQVHALGLLGGLSSCRSLRMGATRLGEPSDRSGAAELAADAANLPTVLADLPLPLLDRIRAELAALVPGLASFAVVRDGDELRIDFELVSGDRLPARLMSDGTLRILVLLTALRLEPRPHLACIEEPESGIYPGRLHALLNVLRDEAARTHDDPLSLARLDDEVAAGSAGVHSNLLPTQIVLTTHSPVILSALREHPQHLRFVDYVRRDDHRLTRVRTVGRPATDHPRFTISPREIDSLLDAALSEESP